MIKNTIIAIALLMAVPVFGKGKGINWNGKWSTNKVKKSIISDAPIIGSIDEIEGDLTLEFVENLGDVVVTVTDNNGNTVYQENVSTATMPTINVSLQQLAVTNGAVSVTDGVNFIYDIFNLIK